MKNFVSTRSTSGSANEAALTCVKCGDTKPAFRMYADTKGEPWKDYYCDHCFATELAEGRGQLEE